MNITDSYYLYMNADMEIKRAFVKGMEYACKICGTRLKACGKLCDFRSLRNEYCWK